MVAYMRGSNANLGGAFRTSAESDAVIERARAAAADFTGSEPEEIAFGANMTTLNFQLAHAVARTLEPGDEIVVTDLDHDANVAPWLLVAGDHDLVVREAPIRAADGTLDDDALEALLGERTRVVAFTLASNALGSITDAARIAAAAGARGRARVGRRRAPGAPPPPAPRGARDRRAALLAVQVLRPPPRRGRHRAAGWPRRFRPTASGPPRNGRPGTGSRPARSPTRRSRAPPPRSSTCAPWATATSTRAFERIRDHEEALSRRFLEAAPGIPGLDLYGIADPGRVGERTPTFCFNLGDWEPRALAAELAARDIYVWDGDYYALAPMRALGLSERGAVRAGFLHYTTEDEVDRLLSGPRRSRR